MDFPTDYLLLAGISSAIIALVHVALMARPQLYAYFGAGELAEMHEKGSRFPALATLFLVFLFAIWSAYAFSGAGVFAELPWLRGMLVTSGVIYTLRGLMLPGDVVKFFGKTQPFRMIFFTSVSLATGLLTLYAVWGPLN